MTTSTLSIASVHTTTAQFRAWGSAIAAQFAARLTQTADTGQINWATVNYTASTNTIQGYEIYYLNDTHHATSPIYLKFGYGTGSNSSTPLIRVEIGTGSNGSGTLTGTGSGTTVDIGSGAGSATAANCYFASGTGYFTALIWNASGAAQCVAVQRTCDTDGTPNTKGAVLLYGKGTAGRARALRFESTAAAYTAVTDWAVVPGNSTEMTLGNGDKQIFMHWGMFPDCRPLFASCLGAALDFSGGSTLSVALFGSTSRTYISTGAQWGPAGTGDASNHSALLLYE